MLYSRTNRQQPQEGPLGTPKYQRGPSVFGAAPGASLTAPKPLTENGVLAQKQNLNSLQTGTFAPVQSAQNATNRANMMRQYQAVQLSKGNAMRGNMSLEAAQRGQDQALANAQSMNLDAQNSVNDLQRKYGEDALNRADTYENEAYGRAVDQRNYDTGRIDEGYRRGIDESRYADTRDDVMYGRQYQEGRDAIADQRYTTEYGDRRGDVLYGREESRRLEGKGDANSLIQSVTDPATKNLLLAAQARGENVQTLFAQLQAQGKIPGTGQQRLLSKVDELRAIFPEKSDADLETLARKELTAERTTITQPIDEAEQKRLKTEAEKRLSRLPAGARPGPKDLDALDSINPQAIPVKPRDLSKWMAENKTQGWVKIGATPYKVTGASSIGGEKGDYAILQDESGKTLYMLYDRTITDVKPVRQVQAAPTYTGLTEADTPYVRGVR